MHNPPAFASGLGTGNFQGQLPSFKCLNIKSDYNFSIFLYCLLFLLSLVALKLQRMKFFMQTLENAIFDEFKGNNSALSQ